MDRSPVMVRRLNRNQQVVSGGVIESIWRGTCGEELMLKVDQDRRYPADRRFFSLLLANILAG
jgi:hypothetical protein